MRPGRSTFGTRLERGVRFYTDQAGNIVQDIDYQAYGAQQPTTPVPDEQRVATYSIRQWNGGDTLHKLGVTQLGARLYDPIIGRFLSRDPLITPRTAGTMNPYAFAMNDPINLSDWSGLDPVPGDANDPSAAGGCTGPEKCPGSTDNLIPIVTTASAIGWGKPSQ